MKPNTTFDGLLNRRVMLEQPATGYRVAMDTVFLAAAVPALEGDRVLDIGCGGGGVFLCLACRVPNIKGVGIEIQKEMADLCRRNIERNVFAVGFSIRQQDVTTLPDDMKGIFDHALMNPPYHEDVRHDASPDKTKQTSNTEKTGDLALWIASAALALKSSGTITIIHRADRSSEILSLLKTSFGDIEVLPLLPKKGDKPKRAIYRARKDVPFSIKECQPISLHEASGKYTEEAEAILRHGNGIVFRAD